jgi:hypothetical protein
MSRVPKKSKNLANEKKKKTDGPKTNSNVGIKSRLEVSEIGSMIKIVP